MKVRLTRFAVAVLGVTLLTPASGAAQDRQHGEEQRESWQKVGEIFQAMLVKPGAVVADVGAGDGFFTKRLSAAVGPTGKVLAVDVGAAALRRLRARVTSEGWTNVDVIEGAVDDPKLPPASVDAILIVNAYHEMTEHQAMLAKMKAALKPEGRLVIVEPIAPSRRDGTRAEQGRNHEIAIDFVKQDAKDAGFTRVMMQDPFTTRNHGHGGRTDEEWILVLTPAPAQAKGAANWPASKNADWQSPDLRITIAQYKQLTAQQDVLVLDVRDDAMFRDGHLPGAVLMTVEEISTPEGLAKLKGEKRPIVAYCS